ncbi:aspartate transaminase aat1 [Pichia californica]|nr:aspartate transaminase aat1 [[Candida] californica]
MLIVNQNIAKRSISIFRNLKLAPADPILSQTISFNNDPKPLNYKINLGVGAYRDDNGNSYILNSVKKAEELIRNDPNLNNHEYLPILGTNNYIKLVQNFLFKDEYSNKLLNENRILTGQSLSGTGSLRLISELLKISNNVNKIVIPNPSWSNHKSIFIKSGIEKIDNYRYYNFKTQRLDLVGMLEDLNSLNPGDGVLLHVCCHNPTGVDPNNEEWDKILEIIERKQLIPIFDMAYQGFDKNLNDDLYIIERTCELIFKNNKIKNMILCQSFAKTLGLYGERIGSFSIITSNKEEKEILESQIKVIIRSMYSSPPCQGSKIVEMVLSNPELYNEWELEVGIMRDRLKEMRMLLFNELKRLNCHGPGVNGPTGWEHLIEQNGMFCFTGILPDQVAALEKDSSIYMTSNGRISIAGINSGNVGRLSRAIAGVFSV